MSKRSGFVALAGRPNVGKSTILNSIVGEKVAIVSNRPQTTRRAIRGIATGGDWQLVMIDLPGVQRPRDPLTERMQRRMERELADSDAALFVLNGQQGVGPGDRFIAAAIRNAGVPAVIAVNKVDILDRAATVAALQAASELKLDGEIYPISAAELVREQVLERTREELPHAVEVEVAEIEEREDGLLLVVARIWVETESQKAILIGKRGKMVQAVGTAARKQIELLIGRRVHLDLTVRVRRGWRQDDALLDRLGID
jgi:GTP-binding protein Era